MDDLILIGKSHDVLSNGERNLTCFLREKCNRGGKETGIASLFTALSLCWNLDQREETKTVINRLQPEKLLR